MNTAPLPMKMFLSRDWIMANNFTYSTTGLTLTKRFEGLRLQSYQDIAGHWTIGYGHKGQGVRPNQTITQAQATALLEADLRAAETVVNRCVKYQLTQNEFDALVDMAYNIGIGAFASSELVAYLNEGKLPLAEGQFDVWCHAGGRVVAQLLTRRQAELALFEQATGTGTTMATPTTTTAAPTAAKEA